MVPRLQVAIFDLGGVLLRKHSKPGPGDIAPSAWTLVAESLGPDAAREEDQTKDYWNAGRYRSFTEWNEASLAIHKKYGLTKSLFESVMDSSIQFHPNVKTTIDMLRESSVKTGIISGGFQYQVDRVKGLLNMDFAFASCSYSWDSSGTLSDWNIADTDYEQKVELARSIVRECGGDLQDCAYVGEGSNDIPVCKSVGVSIAFNASKKLQAVATYSITQPSGQEDFQPVQDILRRYLNPYK